MSPGSDIIKLISCSTELNMKIIMLIKIKMPTMVGILTFMSMKNTTSVSLKVRTVFIFHDSNFNEQLKFDAQLKDIL